jgi:osmotically-inducible protein OsmY
MKHTTFIKHAIGAAALVAAFGAVAQTATAPRPGVGNADVSTPNQQATGQDAKRVVTDSVITTRVKAKYAVDETVKATKIKVDTKRGIVTLSGNAMSKAEADRAVAMARETDGVNSVVNNIRIAR